jgi:hypothetical protein
VGVRANDAEFAARLREVLRAHVVSGVDAPPNLSLFVGNDRGQVRELHRLYRGGFVMVHTRSEGRLLRAALSYLEGFAEPAGDIVRLNVRLLIREQAAVLVDTQIGPQLDRIERRLERLGYQVADVPGAPLDGEAAEVALGPPQLEVDAGALAAFDDQHPRGDREFPLVEARLPIRAVVVFGNEADHEPGSPARRLTRLAHLLLASDGVVRAGDLDLLRRLDEKGVVQVVGSLNDRDLTELLGSLR